MSDSYNTADAFITLTELTTVSVKMSQVRRLRPWGFGLMIHKLPTVGT